jgi:hypothetical protein
MGKSRIALPVEEVVMVFESITWALWDGEYDSQPLLIRFREFPQNFPRAKYPERVNIFWSMSETDQNGLPADEEFTRLKTFEDRLVDAVEHDEHSILAGVLTCNGEREYIFQTADVPGFLERLTNMPQEEERYPITIQKNHDPDWAYFEDVVPDS